MLSHESIEIYCKHMEQLKNTVNMEQLKKYCILYVIQLSDRVYNVTLYTLSDSRITDILRI